MFLELKNFKCFEKASFDLSSKFVLISGASGAGKTTIFAAIEFAVTGRGKKLVAFGKKSCRVILSMGDLKITRTKNPCRLIVTHGERDYEDAAGQAVIDEKLAHFETGYVCQRMHKSFAAMTPSEKLETIEGIAFRGQNVDKIRAEIKSLISERKKRFETVSCQLVATENLLTKLGGKTRADASFDPDKIDQDLFEIDSKIGILSIAKGRLKELVAGRTEIEKRLSKLKSVESFERSESELIAIISEAQRIKTLIAERRSLVNSGFSPQEIEERIKTGKRIKELEIRTAQNASVPNEIEKLEKYWDKRCAFFSCPKCFSQLGLWKNELIEKNESFQRVSVKEADEATAKLMELKAKRETLEKDLQELKLLKDGNRIDIEKLREMKRVDFRCVQLDSELETVDLTVADAENRATEELKAVRERTEKNLLSAKAESLDRQIESLAGTEEALIIASEEKTKLERAKKTIELTKLTLEAESLEKEKEIANAKLSSAIFLNGLLKKAEQLALKETLREINDCAETLLKEFFENVSARVLCDGKMEIFLESNEIDAQSLSGGEFARVALAFAVSIASVTSAPALLLDESLASLDAHASETVLKAIADNFHERIIVIAHQTTTGIFDEVIKV